MDNSKVDLQQERIDFENAYNIIRTHPDSKKQLERGKGGKYTYNHIELAWKLWVFRAALSLD